jgi:uncharacterized DUF497 family protein
VNIRLSRSFKNDGAFQWDDRKAADNYAKHGVRFETARDVFRTHSLSRGSMIARTMAKSASAIIGMADNRLLFVAYTMRDGYIRVISARGAEPDERRHYYED